MPRYVPVSKQDFASGTWAAPKNFGFAAAEAVAPVFAMEMGVLALSMPLAFIQTPSGFSLVAVLSLEPGRNMFVGPAGNWLGGQVPAVFRCYPFRLLSMPGEDAATLCIDLDSGLVGQANVCANAFFGDDGQVSSVLQSVMQFCVEIDRSRRVTEAAVAALGAAGVLKPWPIKLKTAQGDQDVAGLFRVDEAALGELDDAAFVELRHKGCLQIAYVQALSVGHLGVFQKLDELQRQLTAAAMAPPASTRPGGKAYAIHDDGLVQF